MSVLRTFLRDERAAAAVELAYLSPALLVLGFGTVAYSAAITAKLYLTNASSDVAELVAMQPAVVKAQVDDFCIAGQIDFGQMNVSTLGFAIASVTNKAGTVTVDWQYQCNGVAAIANPASIASSVVPTAGDSVIVVYGTYTYTPVVSVFSSVPLPLSQISLYRPRSNTTIPLS